MLQELAPCTCGLLYGSCGGCGRGCVGGASAFSVLLPMAGGRYRRCGDEEGGGGAYGGGSVDCTLSLGTPSTRRAEAGAHGPVGLASFWDAVSGCGGGNGKQQESSGACREANVVAAGGSVLVRRCANCDRTSTPLWRNGPRGPKSLCNACGIRYKKEERRAAAAAAPPTSDSGVGYAYGYARQQQQQPQWGCYGPAAAKTAASFAILGDVDAADKVGPCLSWRLGVMPSSPAFAVQERHSLFQYY